MKRGLVKADSTKAFWDGSRGDETRIEESPEIKKSRGFLVSINGWNSWAPDKEPMV
jgi:hypothetical protein